MFAVNILRFVGWLEVVLVAIPSFFYAIIALIAFSQGSFGAGAVILSLVVVVFVLSSTLGALLLALATITESSLALKEGVGSVDDNISQLVQHLRYSFPNSPAGF